MLRFRPSALHALLTSASLAGVGIAIVGTGLGPKLAAGFAEVDQGDPRLLAAAALAFASTLAGCGLAWHAGLRAAGTSTRRADAISRYVSGSLVNSVVPLRAGGVVRLGLYVRVARNARTVAGVAAAIGSARTASLALMVCVASATAPVPTWPAIVLVGAALAAAGCALLLARSRSGLRAVAGWVSVAVLARLVGAALVAAAFDAPRPVLTAIAIVAAIELAATLPLTPGNIGLSSAAVAFVLAAQGMPGDVALAAGLALALVETATSLAVGVCGVAYLTRAAAATADPPHETLTPIAIAAT